MPDADQKRNQFHPDLDDSLVPRQREGYHVEKIPCCLLLKDKGGNMVLKLNDTGVLIWQLCTEDLTVGEMLALLRDNYPEQQDVISRDVYRVLDTFKEYEVIDLI